jgi:D-alanyl-lipoteichoic acid acyltransferase DltB (MBOAT superfamily)
VLFSSTAFLIGFLPAALALFYALRAAGRREASLNFLLFASLAFYAVWSVAHLALLLASILANYALGRVIAAAPNAPLRCAALLLGIGGDLALLFCFKYLDFAGSNLAALTGADWTFHHLVLPLGLSFFTFQQIAYLVDCRRSGGAEKSLRDYALFVTFFPQLIAGPIVHHQTTRPQFSALARGRLDIDAIPYGVMIFAMGLAKKSLIADPIARAIDPAWAAVAAGEPVAAGAAWMATIGYALQIYFDFSGYSDMAIGLGLLFGVRLPVNFHSPYRARSIIEFWRRWHMTLSAFLKDYVYIPLGGGRAGDLRRLRNIFLTMLIGGLWHGAAWTFVLWGAIHAALITLNQAARLYVPQLDRCNGLLARGLKRAALLVSVTFAWVYFRAPTLDAAHRMFAGLVSPGPHSADPFALALIAFAAGLALFAPNSLDVAGYVATPGRALPQGGGARMLRPTPLAAAATAVMLAGGIAAAWRPSVFIYFNF